MSSTHSFPSDQAMNRSLVLLVQRAREKSLHISNLEHIFGTRTWDDVRSSVTSAARRTRIAATETDLEDAVSEAMLDLVDYWVTLKSSISDDVERNFAYAYTRGLWTTVRHLKERRSLIDDELSLDNLEVLEEWDEPDLAFAGLSDEPFAALNNRNRKGDWSETPSAEDRYLHHIEYDHIVKAVNGMTDRQFNKWFHAFWNGETVKDTAAREGVTPQAVSQQRARGLRRLAGSVNVR